MRKIACFFVLVLFSVALLYADDMNKGTPMTGWICNSKCVVQAGDKASCDQNCAETSGDAVFVDDQGKLYKISEKNQDMAKKQMNKHVKMMAEMDKDQKELERIHFLNQQAP
jgi:hypothetical protein